MEEDFEKRTQNFLKWLETNGVLLSPKMRLVDLRQEGRGRGAIATDNFDEDEIIFSIPRRSTLNIKNTLAEFCTANNSIPLEKLTVLPEWAGLATIMASETQNDYSRWSPYFDVLPHNLDSLIFWSPSELAELQASAVLNKIGKANAEATFTEIMKTIPINGATIDLFHRMASIIMAYAFDVPVDDNDEDANDEDFLEDDEPEKTDLTMIPLADMLNADAHKNNARLSYENENLEMRAIRPIKQGDEIFNDYGQLPRSDLLRRYGYITDNYAPFDVVEISTDFITESLVEGRIPDLGLRFTKQDIEQRLDLAERENILEDAFDIAHATSDSPCLSDEFVAFIYVLLVDDATFTSLKSSHSDLPSPSKMKNELVGSIIVQILKLRELQYATTLEQDENLLRVGDHSHRLEMAIEVRLGEKRIIREAIDEARSYQASNKRMRIINTKRGHDDTNRGNQKRQKTS